MMPDWHCSFCLRLVLRSCTHTHTQHAHPTFCAFFVLFPAIFFIIGVLRVLPFRTGQQRNDGFVGPSATAFVQSADSLSSAVRSQIRPPPHFHYLSQIRQRRQHRCLPRRARSERLPDWRSHLHHSSHFPRPPSFSLSSAAPDTLTTSASRRRSSHSLTSRHSPSRSRVRPSHRQSLRLSHSHLFPAPRDAIRPHRAVGRTAAHPLCVGCGRRWQRLLV